MKTLFHCSGFTCWNCFSLAYQIRYLIFLFTAVQEHTPHFKETSCTLHSKQTCKSNWTQFLNYLHFPKNTLIFFLQSGSTSFLARSHVIFCHTEYCMEELLRLSMDIDYPLVYLLYVQKSSCCSFCHPCQILSDPAFSQKH